jgi:AraC-like DNA-binding protein
VNSIMREKIYINDPSHMDLNMYRCGIEDCTGGHSWGPAVRDHYIIHYVLGGKGIFQVNGSTYSLSKYDGFLICPDTVVYYSADAEEPWSYAWVGFHGLKAGAYLRQAGLDQQNSVFRYDKDDFLKNCLMSMIETKQLSKGGEIRLLGLLYEFISQLVETVEDRHTETSNRKEEYVRKAMEFIRMNYSRKTSISEIAHNVGLDRSYLYSLFKEFLNVSPQEFLIDFRIEKACELMLGINLSIGDISRSVGYDDPLMFSKTFKKVKGVSPKEFRAKFILLI